MIVGTKLYKQVVQFKNLNLNPTKDTLCVDIKKNSNFLYKSLNSIQNSNFYTKFEFCIKKVKRKTK